MMFLAKFMFWLMFTHVILSLKLGSVLGHLFEPCDVLV